MTANGRAQRDAVMQEWLAPLIDRIATLEREAGRLASDNQALAQTIGDQRARIAELRNDLARSNMQRSREITLVETTIADLRGRVRLAEAERDAFKRPSPPAVIALGPPEPEGTDQLMLDGEFDLARAAQTIAELQHRVDLAEQEAGTFRAQLSPPVVARDEAEGDRGTPGPPTLRTPQVRTCWRG